MTVDKNDNPDKRRAEDNQSKTVKSGFADPSGNYPSKDYWFETSVNAAGKGQKRNELSIGGGLDGTSVKLPPLGISQYPYNRVMETPAGHVVEYDDTPGSERILIRHNSGSGIEYRTDGSVVLKVENNIVTSVAGSSVLIVDGETHIKCNGNLNLSVAGDLNLNVGGNINTNVGGTKTETINGSYREMVHGTKGSIVKGNRSGTTLGVQTDTVLSGLNTIVKENHRHSIDGDYVGGSSGTYKCTAEGTMVLSTPDMNIAAQSLSVFGATGTIGGTGIVHYGTTYYGTTFHGDLDGTADKAIRSDITNSQTYGEGSTGSALGYSMTNDATATADATAAIMDDYLNQSAYGVIKVSVDEGDTLRNMIDRTVDTGGVTPRTLSTPKTRSRLRDTNNFDNDKFVGTSISSGVISGKIKQAVPSGNIARIANKTGQVRIPYQPIAGKKVSRFQPSKSTFVTTFTPNPMYDINALDSTFPITPKLALGKGILLSRFLGGTGDKVTLSHIKTRDERAMIAKQFSMHVPAIESVNTSTEFKNHRLVVVEGLYKKEPTENLATDSLNDMAQTGRVVVYELHNQDGIIDHDKTYDLALYWKDSLSFEKMILSYDIFNPDESMVSQIILVMPEIGTDYNIVGGKYSNMLETHYNNKLQANELIQIQNSI